MEESEFHTYKFLFLADIDMLWWSWPTSIVAQRVAHAQRNNVPYSNVVRSKVECDGHRRLHGQHFVLVEVGTHTSTDNKTDVLIRSLSALLPQCSKAYA